MTSHQQPEAVGQAPKASLPPMILPIHSLARYIRTRLEVTTRSGQRHRANVCFSHQLDAELFIEAVTDLSRQKPDD